MRRRRLAHLGHGRRRRRRRHDGRNAVDRAAELHRASAGAHRHRSRRHVGLTQAGTNISVANDTDVEIPAEAVDGNLVARLVQHRGNVFYDVAPRDVGKLRVETPLLVAVIKGTQFNVAVQEDSTTISLFEGRLEIRTPDDSDVMQLNAGEIAIRSRIDGAIRVVGMDDERAAAPAAARPAVADAAAARTAPARAAASRTRSSRLSM